jgi:hypothetical protein
MSSRLKTGARVREVLAEGRVGNSRAVRVCRRAQNGCAFGPVRVLCEVVDT